MASGRMARIVGAVGVALVAIIGIGVLATLGGAGHQVGDVAPPLDLGSTSLAEKKGKVVLVDFWATWCGPCRQSLPHIQELYEKYHADGLEVMAISDEPQDTVDKFLAVTHLTLPLYSDPSRRASMQYKVEALPHETLIARSGKISYESEGFSERELEAAIQKALAVEK